MGIKMNWPSVASQNLDAIEIYRSNNLIDEKNPGAPIATLPPTATEYEDNTVTNKSVYYYRIASRKGTERAFGENMNAGYFSEVGPGAEVPIRGDWNSGYFNAVPMAQLISPADLAAKVPILVGYNKGNFTTWHKMVYKGKIIYIPNSWVVAMSWNELYAAGLLFGTDDFGQKPDGAFASPVKQRTIVNINGLDYILRAQRAYDLPYTQYGTADELKTAGGEWRSTMTRLMRAANEPQAGALPRLGDMTSAPGVCLTPHQMSATTAAAFITASTPAVLTAVSLTTRYNVTLVLELIMP